MVVALRLYLSEIRARGVGAQQFALDVLLDALDHAVLVQEVHLVLGGVDVDVHVLRRDLQAALVRRADVKHQIIEVRGEMRRCDTGHLR